MVPRPTWKHEMRRSLVVSMLGCVLQNSMRSTSAQSRVRSCWQAQTTRQRRQSRRNTLDSHGPMKMRQLVAKSTVTCAL